MCGWVDVWVGGYLHGLVDAWMDGPGVRCPVQLRSAPACGLKQAQAGALALSPEVSHHARKPTTYQRKV